MPAPPQPVTIVTGASSGIGREVARGLVERGGRVALWARREDVLAELQAELGGASLAVGCDVADPDQVERALARSCDSLGAIDAVVNAAGIAEPLELESLDAAAWQRTVDANLNGAFFVCRAAAAAMQAQGRSGTIVNLGSELSSMGMPSYAAYCASKAAVVGLTKALAAELAPRIRVNVLCPGPVDTPMLRGEIALAPDPEEVWRSEGERVPLGRVSEPAEIAAAVIWLLLDVPYATGALVPVDGGTTAV